MDMDTAGSVLCRVFALLDYRLEIGFLSLVSVSLISRIVDLCSWLRFLVFQKEFE